MNTDQNPKKYISRNKDGFACTYDSETHLCVGVILSMGDDIDLYNKKHDEYIGQLDPQYEKKS